MAASLYLPKRAFGDLRQLVQLPAESLVALVRLFGTPDSIEPFESEFIRRVCSELAVDAPTAQSIAMVANYLLLVVEEGTASSQAISEVRAFLETHVTEEDVSLLQELDSKREVLVQLLSPQAERTKAKKIRHLRGGIHCNAESFRTICDVRPVFESNADDEQIVAFVPGVLLEIETVDTQGERRSILLNMEPRALDELREVLARTAKKLQAIRDRFTKEDMLWE